MNNAIQHDDFATNPLPAAGRPSTMLIEQRADLT